MNMREIWKEDTILDAGGNRRARRNLRGQVWIENQIHIQLWPDWESNLGRFGERHGNNRCANPPAQVFITEYMVIASRPKYIPHPLPDWNLDSQ